MRGRNELWLNVATMKEALQVWLDAKMPNGAPTVTNVIFDSSTAYPGFVVEVSSDVDRPVAQKA